MTRDFHMWAIHSVHRDGLYPSGLYEERGRPCLYGTRAEAENWRCDILLGIGRLPDDARAKANRWRYTLIRVAVTVKVDLP